MSDVYIVRAGWLVADWHRFPTLGDAVTYARWIAGAWGEVEIARGDPDRPDTWVTVLRMRPPGGTALHLHTTDGRRCKVEREGEFVLWHVEGWFGPFKWPADVVLDQTDTVPLTLDGLTRTRIGPHELARVKAWLRRSF